MKVAWIVKKFITNSIIFNPAQIMVYGAFHTSLNRMLTQIKQACLKPQGRPPPMPRTKLPKKKLSGGIKILKIINLLD